MEAKDRRFAEIAARLQLLTQEQITTCVQYIRGKPGKALSAAALDLGFLNSEQADRILGYEARLLERQREQQNRKAAVVAEENAPRPDPRAGAGFTEERVYKSDPRSASAPPRTQDRRAAAPGPARPAPTVTGRTDRPKAPVKRPSGAEPMPRPPTPQRETRVRSNTEPQPAAAPERKPQRGWEAPARREDGQVLVPQTPPDRPARGRGGHNAPTAKVSEPAIRRPTLQDLDEPSARSSQDLRVTLPPPPAAPAAAVTAPAAAPAPAPAVAADAGWFDLRDVSRPLHLKPPPVGHKEGAPPLAEPATTSGSSQNMPAQSAAAQAFGYGGPQPGFPQQPGSPQPGFPQSPGAGHASAPAAAFDAHIPGTTGRAATVAPANSYLGRALALAIKQGASDLHAHSGAPIMIRVDGTLRALSGNDALTATAAEKVIAEVMGEAQKATLQAKGEVDFACELPGLARMRVNVYRQQRGLDAVFRLVPREAPSFEQLGLPQRLSKLTDYRTGMVLCTGPAGSGKSTTLSALVSALVQTRADHILSIEDPVEFVYPPGKALVNQRQIRDHTTSFARALRAALREDPDIIVITELRDRDTISLAISAAETGHLVLGTLTTGNASQTISRIVSSFSSDEQEQMRVMLSESLRAVISQRLVPRAKGGGRVPAIELLMVNTAVSNLIRDDKTHQLPSVMQTGKAAGMMTLDDSLDELLRAGTITVESARRFAVRKERFGG